MRNKASGHRNIVVKMRRECAGFSGMADRLGWEARTAWSLGVLEGVSWRRKILICGDALGP